MKISYFYKKARKSDKYARDCVEAGVGAYFWYFCHFSPIRGLVGFVEEVISYQPDVALRKIIIAKAYGDTRMGLSWYLIIKQVN